MADNEGFGGDHLRGATSFSQLLLADDDGDVDVAVGLDVDRTFNYSSVFSSEKPPKMLCFGNYQHKAEPVYSETTRTPPQKSGVTCSDSSSASSSNNSSINTFSKSAPTKKRNGSGQELVQCMSTSTTATVAGQRTSKKLKMENPTPTPAGHAKRKEKLGERITTLQQLVSPFGKIRRRCCTKRWDISGFCTTRFRSSAPLTFNACHLPHPTTYLMRAEKTGEKQKRT
ncbi:transcription factor bHLH113 isoform X2 [Corylus avellana]|uniref:transcription factor bHLH113 isoform X2 n=1 Tax=Corylus avellana TaxID=13451 RepID=UPI00286AC7E3|nr:transcription factor bHLH113 isoform X2 [Corylus avellana]